MNACLGMDLNKNLEALLQTMKALTEKEFPYWKICMTGGFTTSLDYAFCQELCQGMKSLIENGFHVQTLKCV